MAKKAPQRERVVKNYNLNATQSAVDAIESAAAREGERFPGRWILREAVKRANELNAAAMEKNTTNGNRSVGLRRPA